MFYSTLQGHTGAKHDFSYANLRDMVGNFLTKYQPDEREFDDAIKKGVEKFQTGGLTLATEGGYAADLQLLVQHLLNYQNFNLGQLKRDTDTNQRENAFRANEIEKSEWMLSQSPYQHRELLVPRQPDAQSFLGNSTSMAFGALIDLNRPLAHSIMGGETYKAVFLLARELYKTAFEKAQAASESQTTTTTGVGDAGSEQARRFRQQRQFYNSTLFNIVGGMRVSATTSADVKDVIEENDTNVEPGPNDSDAEMDPTDADQVTDTKAAAPSAERRGKTFLTDTLKVPFNEDEGSFDEASDFESEAELSSDDELYDPEENIFDAAAKRKRALNSLGLLTKISSQKAIIDEPSEETKVKFRRVRRRINRQTSKLSDRYKERYTHITSELNYLNSKKKLLAGHMKTIERELGVLTFFDDEDASVTGMSKRLRSLEDDETDIPNLESLMEFNKSTKGMDARKREYKDQLLALRVKLREGKKSRKAIERRIASLEAAKRRARRLDKRVDTFYGKQTMRALIKKRERPDWRTSDHPRVFGNLGEQSMANYIFTEGDEDETEVQEPATKKRRK